MLLKRLRVLLRFGIDLGWLKEDPTLRVKAYRSIELHTWTEEERDDAIEVWRRTRQTVQLGYQQSVALTEILQAPLEFGSAGIDAWPLLLEDLVAAFELLELHRQVLA
jgi:hypothetical protein